MKRYSIDGIDRQRAESVATYETRTMSIQKKNASSSTSSIASVAWVVTSAIFFATTIVFLVLWLVTNDNTITITAELVETPEDINGNFEILSGHEQMYGYQNGGFGISSYADASYRLPLGACFSPDGAQVIVADSFNQQVRAVDVESLVSSTFSEVALTATTLQYPIPDAQLESSNPLDSYWDISISDSERYANWQATRTMVQVTSTVADGSDFSFPVAVSRSYQAIFVAMRDSNAIYSFDELGSRLLLAGSPADGQNACIADELIDGALLNATFCHPRSIAASKDGNFVYVSGEGDPLSSDATAKAR